MRKAMMVAMLASMLGLFAAAPALAQDSTRIEYAIEGDARGNPGETVVLLEETIAPELVGATCTGFIQIENNASVWPGNTLIIETGGQTAEVPNVEDVPGRTINLAGSIVAGETLTVSLRFGEGGRTSGGFLLVADCVPAQVEATTTTTPSGAVDAGAGGTAGADDSTSGLLLVGMGLVVLAGGGVLLVTRR